MPGDGGQLHLGRLAGQSSVASGGHPGMGGGGQQFEADMDAGQAQ